MNRQIILVAHNIRSCHNVGSLLRTADGLGLKTVYLTGYTPYPLLKKDSRLPHLATKLDKQISKTALGAEKSVNWHHESDVRKIVTKLKAQKITVVALEQTTNSLNLSSYEPSGKIALIVGNEVNGLPSKLLLQTDVIVQIPMLGSKESFNVAQATAMALYHLRFS